MSKDESSTSSIIGEEERDSNEVPIQIEDITEEENRAFLEGRDPVLDMMAKLTVISQPES